MSVKHLQEKIGVKADGVFGPGTLKAAAKHYNLSPEHAAHFFGQVAHETGNFRAFTENLNYSASGLQTVFKKYFPSLTEAQQYERKPEKIANRVYASRMSNGNEASGDGWKFRGRGALQLTGKANYQQFSTALKKPEIMSNPDLVSTEFAFESAKFFFDQNRLWPLCDKVNDESILALTRRINGGTHGLEDRVQKTRAYYEMLRRA